MLSNKKNIILDTDVPYSYSTYHPESRLPIVEKKMFKEGGSGFIRKTMFATEIIWNTRRYVFKYKQDKKPITGELLVNKKIKKEDSQEDQNKNNIFLFNLVSKDAKKYSDKNKAIPATIYSAVRFNKELKNAKYIAGTDIDDAYWTIAYQMGVISERTYDHGLTIDDKDLMLASLANMGSDKVYGIVENGIKARHRRIYKGDDNLKIIYKNIRNTCYKYMSDIAELLKQDFLFYKVDCIYYADTEKNRNIVYDFFESKALNYKKSISKKPKK